MKYEKEISKGQVIKALFWKMLERLSVQGINLVVQIVLARLLLPSDFGSLAIIVAITNFATLFVQSGLSTVITRSEEIDKKDISTFLTASLFIAGILYAILFLLSPIIAESYAVPELRWALRAQAVILFLNSFNSIQTAVLSRKMQFKKIFLRSLFAVPISGALGILLALIGWGVWALVIHNIVNVLLIVIFMSFDSELRFSFGFSYKRLKKHLPFSVKILLASLVSSGHDTIRTMIIGAKFSKDDLAYHDKALTYSAYVTQTVYASIQSVLLPTFSSAQTNVEHLQRMARNSVRLSMFVMSPIMIGVAMISRPLIMVLLTEKWEGCIPYFVLFCILRLPGCMNAIDKQVYYAIGKSGINFAYEVGLFVVNLLVLLLTMQYGVMAIVIGATAVELFGALAICCISAIQYKYTLLQRVCDLLPTLCCTVIMACCVRLVGLIEMGNIATLFVQITIGIASYIIVSILINRKVVKLVISILKNIKNKKEVKQ